ncbi:hypothetical protein [Paenibacillus herberti]|uniref:Uncharacterized protein n=1 Tax=Paenibacillus herberti TaxID=1619309 RepID=A0A229P5D9_9BACL|nr:hypothetical protein [Paenibacillus herberti]OXM17338.1 hypothetical protein CGZ75_12255 [Paenibacillus herberti]
MLNKWHSYEAAKQLYMATGMEPTLQQVNQQLLGIETEALVDGMIEFYKSQGSGWRVPVVLQGAENRAGVQVGERGSRGTGEELGLLPRTDLEARSLDRQQRAGQSFLRVLDDLETKAELMRELGASTAALCYEYAAGQLRTALADA